MRVMFFPVIILAFTGCVTSNPNPLNNGITTKPYDGVTIASYGVLSKGPLEYCGSGPHGDPLERALHETGKDLIGQIYKPVGGATVNDPTLIKEELQDQFRTIGNVVTANVVVLKRDEKGITFWYSLDEVSDEEIASAAKKYCGYHKRHPVFLGAARRCGPTTNVPSLVAVNGNRQTIQVAETYVISGFSCL